MVYYNPRERGLADEPLDNQKAQYQAKNEILATFGEEISAATLYEDIFGDLEILMPVILLDEGGGKKILKQTIGEAIEKARGRNDVLMGGTVYFKQFLRKATARYVHALIIDMDNVWSGTLKLIFQLDWGWTTGEKPPRPTYIVNSGTGLHLYFVFKKPLPCFKRNMEQIDKLYRQLATVETTSFIFVRKQVQWFGQDFRMAGGNGKAGWLNTAFRVGEKWQPEELSKALGLDAKFTQHTAEPMEEPKGRGKSHKKEGYRLNSRVYESTLERVRKETREGNRYTSVCALSILAWKCGIAKDKLLADMYSLVPGFNDQNAKKPFYPREISSAVKMYNPKALLTPRYRLELWLGFQFKGCRRNGRTRIAHLKRARAVEAIDYPNNGWAGRKDKRAVVQEWRQMHPAGRKVDCQRDTGLSKPTILKWWHTAENE